MRRTPAALAPVLLLLAVAGCGEGEAQPAGPASAPAADEAPVTVDPVEAADAPEAPEAGPAPGTTPAFAVAYPGAEIEQATRGQGGVTDGGLVVFTTEAAADDVIAFYREHAQAAGMASTMAMAQGDTRAYGASHPRDGSALSVVASTAGDRTSVQLSWSGPVAP
jgi:hypothetical protein